MLYEYVNLNHSTYYKSSFPAILRSEDGLFVEQGTATFSEDNQSVDFHGEFIPLYTMGTPMTVTRTFKGQELHKFSGEVYLSSKNLLRITSVTDELLQDSENFYLFPLVAFGYVDVLVEGKPRLFQRKPVTAIERCRVTLSRIALDAIEFHSSSVFSVEDELSFSMTSPFPLHDIPLKVTRALEFGSGGTSYFCHIAYFPDGMYPAWKKFVKDLHLKNNRLF